MVPLVGAALTAAVEIWPEQVYSVSVLSTAVSLATSRIRSRNSHRRHLSDLGKIRGSGAARDVRITRHSAANVSDHYPSRRKGNLITK